MAHTYIHAKDSTGAVHPVLVKTNGELVLDTIESGINQIKDNTSLVHSRLSNIQDWVGTEGGDGTGDKLGVMVKSMDTRLDLCDSSLNTIEANSTLSASRLNNIQNKLSENTDGTGDTVGELLKSLDLTMDNIASRTHTMSGAQANLMSSVSCVAAGTTSSTVDFFLTVAVPKKVSIIVNCATSPASFGFEVYGSADNSTWGRIQTASMSNTNLAGGTILTQGGCTIDWTMRYLRIIVYSLGTYTATVIGLA